MDKGCVTSFRQDVGFHWAFARKMYEKSSYSTKALSLLVNGEAHVLNVVTLAEALAVLGYDDAIVATALNGEFVSKGTRTHTRLKTGDKIEIVAPLQGG